MKELTEEQKEQKEREEKYKLYLEITRNNIKKLKKEIDLYHSFIGILKKDNKDYIKDKENNEDNIDNIQEEIKQLLIKTLPHGSGIDCDWEFIFHKNGNIDCKNSFHAMNENGYYVKWIPITIKFYRFKRNIYHKYGIKNEVRYQVIEEKDCLDYKIFAPNCDYYAYGLCDILYSDMYNFEGIIKSQYNKIDKKDFEKPYIIR